MTFAAANTISVLSLARLDAKMKSLISLREVFEKWLTMPISFTMIRRTIKEKTKVGLYI